MFIFQFYPNKTVCGEKITLFNRIDSFFFLWTPGRAAVALVTANGDPNKQSITAPVCNIEITVQCI